MGLHFRGEKALLRTLTILGAVVGIQESGFCQAWDSKLIYGALFTAPNNAILSSKPAWNGPVGIAAISDEVNFTPSRIRIATTADEGQNWTNRPVRGSEAVPPAAVESKPVVASDGNGTWICSWQSNLFNGSVTSDTEILVSRSVNNGTSWTVPQAISLNPGFDVGNDVSPAIVVNDMGEFTVAWSSDNDPATNGTSLAVQASIWASKSADGGLTWQTPEPILIDAESNLVAPSVCKGTSGTLGLIFGMNSTVTTGSKIAVSYYSASQTTWTASEILAEAGSSTSLVSLPVVECSADGEWMAVWQETIGGFARLAGAHKASLESAWSPLLEISSKSNLRSYAPSVTAIDDKWLIGASYQNTNIQGIITVTPDDGANWMELPAISPTVLQETRFATELVPFPYMSSADILKVYLTRSYYFKFPPDPNVYSNLALVQSTLSLLDGPPVTDEWSSPASFNQNPVFGKNPRLTHNGKNQWTCVFTAKANGQTDDDLFYTVSSDGEDWSEPKQLASDWATDSGNDTDAMLAGGDNGYWLCTWMRNGAAWIARKKMNEPDWEAAMPLELEGSAVSPSYKPSIAYLGNSRWILSVSLAQFSSTDNGASWSRLSTLSGAYQFGSCGNTTPCATEFLSEPIIYADPSGTSSAGFNPIRLAVTRTRVSRLSGYSGPTETSTGMGVLDSVDGLTFPGTNVGGQWFNSLNLSQGSNIMANDRNGKWMWASEGGGKVSFSTKAVNVSGRQDKSPTISLDSFGNSCAFWIGQSLTLDLRVNDYLLNIRSENGGSAWTETKEVDTSAIDSYGDFVLVESATDYRGRFVAVYQTRDSEQVDMLWFSYRGDYIAPPSSAKDWMLYN